MLLSNVIAPQIVTSAAQIPTLVSEIQAEIRTLPEHYGIAASGQLLSGCSACPR